MFGGFAATTRTTLPDPRGGTRLALRHFPQIHRIFTKMKLSDWQHYEWDLDEFPVSQRPKLPPFVFRPATAEDRDIVEKVIRSAFWQEAGTSDGIDSPLPSTDQACDLAFTAAFTACVVVQHGSRIIGASVMTPAPDAENHLLTGPAILHEYRNRGIGSALLFASLDFLKDAGVTQAIGIARAQSTAARFVYSKYDGKPIPVLKTGPVDTVEA